MSLEYIRPSEQSSPRWSRQSFGCSTRAGNGSGAGRQAGSSVIAGAVTRRGTGSSPGVEQAWSRQAGEQASVQAGFSGVEQPAFPVLVQAGVSGR